MNVQGTIDHPATHDPRLRHLPKQDPTMTPTSDSPAHRRTGAVTARQNRNRQMQLMPESLARAHMETRMRETESGRAGRRVLTARRLQRKAERASQRARRALAMAVMQ
jgi:hypothetical protein